MRATLTAYVNHSDRKKAIAIVKSVTGEYLDFFSEKNLCLSLAGETSIEVRNQSEAFEIERELLKFDVLKDVDVLIDDSFEEQLINERYSGVNELINDSKSKRPDPSWYHNNIKLKEAFAFLQESFENGSGYYDINKSKINLALIDTGYSNHPEITRIDKVNGRNFLKWESFKKPLDKLQSTRPFPISWGGHGTSCAGIINGVQAIIPIDNQIPKKDVLFDDLNNGLDKYGSINVIPFRVSRNIISFGNKMPRAINYIIKNGTMPVVSMSHASLMNRKSYRLATIDAYKNGVIFIAAPGSHVFRSKKVYTYPAKYPWTIAPAASKQNNRPWAYTHGGREVDVCAPGYEIYIPYPYKKKKRIGYGYKWSEGSSFAVPIIATAACLWRMHHGSGLDNFSPVEQIELFRSILKRTVTRFPDDDISTKLYGSGVVNFEKLMKEPLDRVQFEKKKPLDMFISQDINFENFYSIDKEEETIKRELMFLKLNEISFNSEKSINELDYFQDRGSDLMKNWINQIKKNNKQPLIKIKSIIEDSLNR
ncbi:S8 family serine peptidase [Tamlana haliotis]|uniref:S8 family serine peptidase n=1 Tax=Pseudotamlana haliotis TaxID=2614804 RepID=A0A6N6MEZ7_9FLAO|nr:S8 family serine peptidase [Tamlana haliotis]KAB1067947.1 S8 family serine peptidase [Tamlana haliotis]